MIIYPLFFASGKTVRVGVYENKPLIFKDVHGNVSGIVPDVLLHIATEEKWDIHWEHATWNQSLKNLQNEKIELQTVIGFSEKRNDIYDFTKTSLIENWGVIYVKQQNSDLLIDGLKDKKVAVLVQDIYYKAFQNEVEQKGVAYTAVMVKDYNHAFQLLAAGEVDAAIVNRIFGIMNEDKYGVHKTTIIFSPIDIKFAVKKGVNADILERIDHHMARLKVDKTSLYYKSLDRWFSKTTLVWWKRVPIVVVVFSVLGLIAGYFLFNLYKKS